MTPKSVVAVAVFAVAGVIPWHGARPSPSVASEGVTAPAADGVVITAPPPKVVTGDDAFAGATGMRTFAHGWARGRYIVGPDVNVTGMSQRDPRSVRLEVRDRLNHKRVDIFYLLACIGPGVTWQRSDSVSIDPPVSFSWTPPSTVDYCMLDTKAGQDAPGFVSVRNRAAY